MSAPLPEPAESGWHAQLELGFQPQTIVGQPPRTVLAHRRRSGPLAVQRALYPEGEVCHVYLLHPPGGVVGGDQLDIKVDVDGGHALITTPGATKFYRSAGADARQNQTLRVASGASLEWLPQETIVFPGAQIVARTRIDLSGDARVAAWESLCFGRPSNAERFNEGRGEFRFEIWRDGHPLLLELLRVSPDTLLACGSLLNNRPVVATFVLSACDKAALDQARQRIATLPAAAQLGLTLIEDLLVTRYLGDSTEQARQAFIAIWSTLRPNVLKKAAQEPRIWST